MEKYTQPKLSQAERGWYIHFRYDGKQYRFTESINKIKDLKERAYEYEKLRIVILERLKSGWNPSINIILEQQSSYNLIEGIDLALKKKQSLVNFRSYQEYRGSIRKIKVCILDLKIDHLKINELEKLHVRAILNKAADKYSLTANSYNTLINHFKSVLSTLIDDDIISINPVIGLKKRKHIKAEAHVPASFLNIEKIKKELKENYSNFYVFAMSIFHTGIRPEELLRVRLSMVDLELFEIRLTNDITKNGKPRTVPINNYLLPFFVAMNFSDLPKDYFLFGSDKEKFKHNKNANRDYIPAPSKIRREYASILWREVVKDKLGINMTLYALKKHGANAKILAGVSIGALKDLFGHSSELTTAIYITKLKEINRKEILDKSPDF